MKPLWYPPHAFYCKTRDVLIIESMFSPKGIVARPDPLFYSTRMVYGAYVDMSTYNIRPVLVPKNSDLFHLILLRTLQNPDADRLLRFLATRNTAVLPLENLFLFDVTPEKADFWKRVTRGDPARVFPRESENDIREFKERLRRLNLL